ncbi:LPS export ABC transporter permease LptG [Sodalis-like secondary symbiont of Drepanosiphum platanoidis]|uniref:LPS export ABC transporter permease LptG n=1 Tax=Sodalis-like secondary symbiont of Drepanosiphum platanoidis TaxID=2994493 RepID=UPI0034640007
MFLILEKYICSIILKINLIILSVLIFLSGIIKFIEQLKQIGKGKYFISSAGLYTILSIPKDIQIFFPMSIMISTMFGLGFLIKKNELIIMQTLGFSRIQIIRSIMKVIIPLIFINMIINEFITPSIDQLARKYRTKMMYNNSIISIKDGVWIKDKNKFIFIKKIIEKNKLRDIHIYELNLYKKIIRIYNAKSAIIFNKIWNLSEVTEYIFNNKKKIYYKKYFLKKIKTSITSKKLNIVLLKPESLSIYQLYNYIKYLNKDKQNSIQYQIHMWNKIFSPIYIFIMVLMDIFFIIGSIFVKKKIYIRIFIGIFFGFLFYIITHIIEYIILFYNISPILGIFLPIIIIFFIILFLF